MNCPSYDPTTYAENHEVIRGRDVLSEAKRKTFRISERQRLGELSKQTNRPEREHGVEMVKINIFFCTTVVLNIFINRML
jgi:hypothetical protein